ncbi:MAG: YbbR-like domain-containing protein, partial [Mycoplasmatales bacterium]
IDGIKLNILSDEDKLITGLPEKIGVNVTGSKSDVTKFKANTSNIVATINLTGRDDGDYKVDSSEIQYSNFNKNLSIDPVVKNYNVTIDTLTKVVKPVEIEYINGELDSPLILEDPVISTPNVTIPIGINNKENISSVKVLLDLTKIKTAGNQGSFNYEEKVKVYDKKGNILETYTELPTVKVNQPYEVNSVTLPVKYQITNNNTDKYISSICKVIEGNNNCLNEVEIYGNQEAIQDLDYITYTLDLEDYEEGNNIIKATPLLAHGIYIAEEGDYRVTVALEEGITKTLENIPVVVQNLDSNLEVVNIDNINIDVTLTGAQSVIENMTANDIMLYIDAAGITTDLTTEMNIYTTIDTTISYELSTTKINVEFKEKE